jgi:hypothetical protein
MVTIRCPITGREIPTGIVLSPLEFERAALEGNVVRCPECGRIHSWTRADARLDEAGQQAR